MARISINTIKLFVSIIMNSNFTTQKNAFKKASIRIIIKLNFDLFLNRIAKNNQLDSIVKL